MVDLFQGFEFRIDEEFSDSEIDSQEFLLYNSAMEKCFSGLTVGLENGLIYGLSYSKILLYKSVNLIGISADCLSQIFDGYKYTVEQFEVIDDWKLIYTFDELGLMLWVDNGIVESADCLSCDDD